LPGISGGAHSERFQPLVDAVLKSSFAIARVSLWEGEESLKQTSPKELSAQIDGAVRSLQEKNYKHIAGVGKSFGGGMLFANTNSAIACKVLWAPFIHYVDVDSNFGHIHFKDLEHLSDLTVDHSQLESYTGAIYFIHGSADTVIPVSNSYTLKNAVRGGADVLVIEGADHSFKQKEHEEELIKKTITCIKKVFG
jgi:dienelactone hydrolase